MFELLTPKEMNKADALTIAGGRAGFTLMQSAAHAIADAAQAMCRQEDGLTRILVLAGPGNNGGDGFLAARYLQDRGFDVSVALLGSRDALRGDAALAADAWGQNVAAFDPALLEQADLVIDALFGAGLARPIEGIGAEMIRALNEANVKVLAVDLPSGLNGEDGQIHGVAMEADATVTFFRKKPGHLLYPGRQICGEIRLAQIGIDDACLQTINPQATINTPSVWQGAWPSLQPDGHKYQRGAALVIAGRAWTSGAARLTARAALRVGAGLVTMTARKSDLMALAGSVTAIMLATLEDAAEIATLVKAQRVSAVAIGPGFGLQRPIKAYVEAALASVKNVVLDADALSAYADEPERLISHLREQAQTGGQVILTPHMGEFARLFPDIAASDIAKQNKAREAAARTHAIIVLKGADTCIAAPDGRVAISDIVAPALATAGSGDVLTGLALGLLAQGMPAYEAASAAVWLHAKAGEMAGRGLIAEDLPDLMPDIFTLLTRDEARG